MWQTRFTALFGPSSGAGAVRLPLMGAPMAGVSNGLLAAETARAGALASIAAGHLLDDAAVESVRRDVELFRASAPPGAPLCVGFIGHSALGRDAAARARVAEVLRSCRPEVVQFFGPAVVRWDESDGTGSSSDAEASMARDNVALARDLGCRAVVAQVGSESDAREALDAGVDVLVAQGTEAGGHGLRPSAGCGTLPLAARIVALTREWEEKEERNRGGKEGEQKTSGRTSSSPAAAKKRKRSTSGDPPKIPVLAAGGIVDGRGVAAALALGCDGAVLGTRLWASTEAGGRDDAKARLASPGAGPDAAVRTTVVDAIVNAYHPTPWPEPFDSSGVLRNGTTERWHGREGELMAALAEAPGAESGDVATDYRTAEKAGNDDVAGIYAGKGVGEIRSIDGVYSIITRINEEAVQSIKGLQSVLPPP